MIKVSLKIVSYDGWADYLNTDDGKSIFSHTQNTKIQSVTVEEQTTIYYKNYNIFCKKIKDTDDENSFIKILSIKNDFVEFQKTKSVSEKIFINKNEKVFKNKFKLKMGESLSIRPCIKDSSIIYTIYVDDLIYED